jgi:threonine dehydrogenase-like Zn-dependent dehydrogenase
MRALTVIPGKSNSIRLDELPAPPASDGAVLVRALALGICGTDHEIINGTMAGRRRVVAEDQSWHRASKITQ